MKSVANARFNKGFKRFHVSLVCLLPAAVLLSACSNTGITASSSLQADDMASWSTVVDQLPVELHGTVKGRTAAQLAGLFPSTVKTLRYASLGPVEISPPQQRVVFYINQMAPPRGPALCDGDFQARPKMQEGAFATVTAALCDGPRVVSFATGLLRAPQNETFLVSGLGMFDAQLIEALDKTPPIEE